MITIVEGPDCSGKSTLIKNGFGFSNYVKHFGPPKGGPDAAWRQYTDALFDAQQTVERWHDDEDGDFARLGRRPDSWHLVYDRFFYGEMIYPRIMNRKSDFNEIQLRMLERVALSMQAVLVAATPSDETALQLYSELKGREMIQDDDKYRISLDHWRTFFGSRAVGLPMVTYDLEKDQYNDIVVKANRLRSPENRGPGIGYYSSQSIVLVGEQVNTNVDLNDWPFVEEGKGGSSYWLTMLLHNLGVPESALYWVNSMARTGHETRPGFIEEMRPRKLVAMGKPAQIWAKRNQLHRYTKVYDIPHPQFHKRFKAGTPYELVEILQQDRDEISL